MFIRIGAVVLCTLASVALTALVRRSAERMIRQSTATPYAAPNKTPFIQMTGIDVRARRAGRPFLRFTADNLTLFRDLRTVSAKGVREGVGYSDGRPAILFSAGGGNFEPGLGGFQAGTLHLTGGVSAAATAQSLPLIMSTSSIDWQSTRNLVTAPAPVRARVGGLGTVQCGGMVIDARSHTADFRSVEGDANAVATARIMANDTPVSNTSTGDSLVHFSAPGGGHWDNAQRVMTFRGPVRIWQGDVTMQTVGATFDRKTDIATALAPVKITDASNVMTGNTGVVNFRTHIATLDADVHLSGVPSRAASSEAEAELNHPTLMVCDHVEYNYRTKLADAGGHLKITQLDRTVTALKGHYDTKAQLVMLKGDVDARSADGRHMRTPTATLSIDPKNEYLELPGPVTGEFTVPADEDTGKQPRSGSRFGNSARPIHSVAQPTGTSNAPLPPMSAGQGPR